MKQPATIINNGLITIHGEAIVSPIKLILISLLTLLIISTLSAFIAISHPIWILNENQILYLYSTSSQVLAGVYGLTLTGFIFFRNELSREESDDESLTEAVESLKDRYFKLLIYVTLISIFTLFIGNLVLSIEDEEKSTFKTIIMNVAQSSFIVSLLTISYFIFDIIAPKRIESASKKLQQQFDPIDKNKKEGSLETFLKNFNQIEALLQKYGQNFQTKGYTIQSSYQPSYQRRMSNQKLALIIAQAEKIDKILYDKIRKLITLRNSIVHSAEPIVSEEMVNESQEILNLLSNLLNDESVE